MHVVMSLEIHFNEHDEVSVNVESSTTTSDERFGEVLLATLFAGRMMANLGPQHPNARKLAQALAAARGEGLRAFMDEGMSLSPYLGKKGKRGFEAPLEFSEDRLHFRMHPWGFRMFGKGVAYCAPAAAELLVAHFASARFDEPTYLSGLGEAVAIVGESWLNGGLTRTNQQQVALDATKRAMIPASER